MNPIYELMKDLIDRISVIEEKIAKDQHNEYLTGRRDAFRKALEICLDLLD